MLINYFRTWLATLIYLAPMACIVFCVFTGVKFLLMRKIKLNPLSMLCEFAWILTVLVILRITGIIGGNFKTTSILNGNVNYCFRFFEEGLSIAMLLNIALFVPFGFLLPIVFRKLLNKWIYVIVIGLVFSITIEFLQTFTGRFVQTDDMVMNTLGTFLGYEIWFLLSKIKMGLKNQEESRN